MLRRLTVAPGQYFDVNLVERQSDCPVAVRDPFGGQEQGLANSAENHQHNIPVVLTVGTPLGARTVGTTVTSTAGYNRPGDFPMRQAMSTTGVEVKGMMSNSVPRSSDSVVTSKRCGSWVGFLCLRNIMDDVGRADSAHEKRDDEDQVRENRFLT